MGWAPGRPPVDGLLQVTPEPGLEDIVLRNHHGGTGPLVNVDGHREAAELLEDRAQKPSPLCTLDVNCEHHSPLPLEMQFDGSAPRHRCGDLHTDYQHLSPRPRMWTNIIGRRTRNAGRLHLHWTRNTARGTLHELEDWSQMAATCMNLYLPESPYS